MRQLNAFFRVASWSQGWHCHGLGAAPGASPPAPARADMGAVGRAEESKSPHFKGFGITPQTISN